MVRHMRSSAVALIVLIEFLVIAPSVMWDALNWECECSHLECEWCYSEEDEWLEFEFEAYEDGLVEFDRIFNSLEAVTIVKGEFTRVMVRRSNGKMARCVIVDSPTIRAKRAVQFNQMAAQEARMEMAA